MSPSKKTTILYFVKNAKIISWRFYRHDMHFKRSPRFSKKEMFSNLRSIYINDDRETVTCVLPTQYSIFSVNPFELKLSRDNFGFSLGSAVTCNGYQLIAFNGLPADPEFDTKQVCIFDNTKFSQDQKNSKVNPLIFRQSFAFHILSMRITPELLIAAFHEHIEIWNHQTQQPVQQIKTVLNVHAPCDVTSNYKLLSVAGRDIYSCILCTLQDRSPVQIRAADETVSLVKFSNTPGLLATTSADGKMIRVFDISTFSQGNELAPLCLGKFKRGNTASVIHSIDFSPTNHFMVIVSQNGTLHFFDLRNKKPSSNPSTFKSNNKISLGIPAISSVMWQTASLIVVLTMDGQMVSLSVDEETCQEVGREHMLFLRRLCEDVIVQA